MLPVVIILVAAVVILLYGRMFIGGPRATWFWDLDRHGIPDHYLNRPEAAFRRWGRDRALDAWEQITEPEHRRRRDYPARDWEWRRIAVRERDSGRCVVCGRGDRPHDSLHTHHRQPFGQGGSHALTNLVLLCGDCHGKEHQRLERGEAVTLLTEAGFGAGNASPARLPGGRCIRCGAAIQLNPDRPFCQVCFRVWAQWENWDYEELRCHACGKDARTSRRKPLCGPCFQEAEVGQRAEL